MKGPVLDSRTQDFYEAEALRYPVIHARPVQLYSAEFERDLFSAHISANALCLDIGCGEGRTTRALAGQPRRSVIGLDFSVEMLRVAKVSNAPINVHYCAGDAMGLPFADGTFDVVLAVTTLNNVPDLSRSLQEMSRVLRPGGSVVLLVINRHELAAVFRALYYLPFYAWRWIAGGKKYHSQTFSATELRTALPSNLTVASFQGMRMLPDMLPEWPLNFYPYFFPSLTRLLRLLAPLDRWLCRHPLFGKLARFHFVAARKGVDA